MPAHRAQDRLWAVAHALKAKSLLLAALSAVVLCVGAAQLALAQPDGQIVAANGKTIVAFFPPVSDEEMDKNPDLNEALSDFQLYTSKVGERLAKDGIEFRVLYVHWFRLRVGKAITAFRPNKVKVGYYFIAPGEKPRIEYGVMTDDDLVQIAHEYFHSSNK